MRDNADLVTRIELPIPRNSNTFLVLEEITDHIAKYFGGAIKIVSQLGGFWFEDRKSVV